MNPVYCWNKMAHCKGKPLLVTQHPPHWCRFNLPDVSELVIELMNADACAMFNGMMSKSCKPLTSKNIPVLIQEIIKTLTTDGS